MSAKYGHTTITCKLCKTVTAIDNESLEKTTDYKCPACGTRMTDREMARLKMHLYLLWVQLYNENCAVPAKLFDYRIDLHPHLVDDVVESEENGNREEG